MIQNDRKREEEGIEGQKKAGEEIERSWECGGDGGPHRTKA